MKSPSNFLEFHALDAKASNLSDIFQGQLRVRVVFASLCAIYPCSMLYRISNIFSSRTPSKVFEEIVRRIPIEMARIMFRRTRPYERLQNENMNENASSRASQRQQFVASTVSDLLHITPFDSLKAGWMSFGRDNPVKAFDISVIRNLIPRVARYVFPYFHVRLKNVGNRNYTLKVTH